MADNIPFVGTYRLLVDRAHEPVSQGTAFCVRSNVVATAFHVIGDEIHGRWHDEDDATVTYRIELSGGISIELEPLLGYPGADLALLRCKDPTRHLSSNDVAVLVGRSPRFFQQWRAGAFPAFASGKQFDLFGRIVSVRPDDGAKALQLHIESGTIADWRGVSGAPIVVAEGVIGLLTNVTENVSAGWAALSSTFCALLTLHDSGVVHELEDWVGAQFQVTGDFDELCTALGALPGSAVLSSTSALVPWLVRAICQKGSNGFERLFALAPHYLGTEVPDELRKRLQVVSAPLVHQRHTREDQLPNFISTTLSEEEHSWVSEINSLREQLKTLNNHEEIMAIRRQIGEYKCFLQRGTEPTSGHCVGGYQLIEQVGEGGFGTVWRAWDDELSRPVALKILHSQHHRDKTRIDRFYRGAKLMYGLSHPNIARVLKLAAFDGRFHYYIMEFLQDDLRRALLRHAVATETLFEIIYGVGAALIYSHSQGAFHRDVKPANILLDESMRPYLSDFDMARAADTNAATRTGGLGGTLIYSAPELFNPENKRDDTSDPRLDVFSLGMTLLCGLYGKDLPIDAFRNTQLFLEIIDCSPLLKQVIARATDWQTDRRYSSIQAFYDDVTSAREHRPVNAPALIFGRPRTIRSWRLALTLLAIVLLFSGLTTMLISKFFSWPTLWPASHSADKRPAKSVNPRLKWRSVTSGTDDQLMAIWGARADDIWAAGEKGTFVRWDGAAWNLFSSEGGHSIRGIWGSNERDVWAVGPGPRIFHWNGNKWANVTSGQNPLYGIFGTAENDIWAVGGEGDTIIHWNGTSWEISNSRVNKIILSGVWAANRSDAWAVGFDSMTLSSALLRWNGTAWSAAPSGTQRALRSIWGAASNDIWVAGENGTATHWDGNSWNLTNTGVDFSLYGLWGSASNDIWAIGGLSSGIILHWTGTSWSQVKIPTTQPLFAIWGSGPSDIWAVGQDGATIHYSP